MIIEITLIFALGMVMGVIVSAGLFRPRWVDVKKSDEIEHEGLIILHYYSGQLEVIRNYHQYSTEKTGLKRYMKL